MNKSLCNPKRWLSNRKITQKTRRFLLLSAIVVLNLITKNVSAQTYRARAIDLTIGYGLSVPYDDVDATGEGFFLQGEYVMPLRSWVEFRPYLAVLLTSDDDDGFRATTNAALIGAKARIRAPIKWFAPYLEGGVGVSIGTFETITPFTNIDTSGPILHIRATLGFEIGPRRGFDFALTYFFHPSVEQFGGAVSFGISIPLN